MHRQRFGYAAVFGWSPPGHEQGGGAKPPLAAAWAGADARCPVRWPRGVRPKATRALTAAGGPRITIWLTRTREAVVAAREAIFSQGGTTLVARIGGGRNPHLTGIQRETRVGVAATPHPMT